MENDLIFISLENWDEIWRRNQFICAELVRRHPSIKLLFVGVQRNLWRYLAKGDGFSLLRDSSARVPQMSQIVVTRPLRIGLERYRHGRLLNQKITRRHIKRIQVSLGLRRPVLWVNPHSAVNLVGHFDEAAVIYDITDDWTTASQSAEAAEMVKRQDSELCGRADAVIVCSNRLFDMKRAMTSSLHLIANGVDAEHYREVLEGGGPLPEAAARWKKPVYGYTGSVHSDRVDVELVRKFAQRTNGTVVLLGPNMLVPEDRARLDLPNVVLFGPLPYQELPKYMRGFDVCIVPHRVTAFTESLNPIKLWEYLAAGKPIVSTDVAGFRDYPQFVHLARNIDEFVLATDVAAKEDPSLAAARQAEARKHSWTRRVDEIERVIDGAIQRRERYGSSERPGA